MEKEKFSASKPSSSPSGDPGSAKTRGKTFISDDVISIIARSAAENVPGVYQIGESSFRNLLSRLDRHYGVESESGLKEAAADLELVVELGSPIRQLTEEVRERVIDAVETMTGRHVVEVNIFVVDIHVPKAAGQRRRRELE